MFTGLIQATGTVAHLKRNGQLYGLRINSSLTQQDLEIGESIAVNGVCLTLTNCDRNSFTADVSSESLEVTTLGKLNSGSLVNLERALRLNDRLGGHIVSGHVDAIGQLRSRQEEGEAQRLEFSLPAAIARYVVPKGSMTIDGISLTINQVAEESFSVMIIPHTLAMTTLKDLRVGGAVNLESDILARYVERLISPAVNGAKKASGVTLEFLAKNGFM